MSDFCNVVTSLYMCKYGAFRKKTETVSNLSFLLWFDTGRFFPYIGNHFISTRKEVLQNMRKYMSRGRIKNWICSNNKNNAKYSHVSIVCNKIYIASALLTSSQEQVSDRTDFAFIWQMHPLLDLAWQESGPRLNIKTVLSTYGDFHFKDKTAVRTSYL